MLVISGLFAIAFVPFALEVLERIFGVALQLPPARVAKIVLLGILAPLGAGLIIRRAVPGFAERIARPLAVVATGLLGTAAAGILVSAWPAMVTLVGDGTLAAFATFVVVGLGVGHLLGGPDPNDRTVPALATASRHPGVALAMASANFPDQDLVLPAVLLAMIAGTILPAPYIRWRQPN